MGAGKTEKAVLDHSMAEATAPADVESDRTGGGSSTGIGARAKDTDPYKVSN